MKLLDYLQNLRKAQLQEYFLRWYPGEMLSDRDKLVERLNLAMCDPKRVRERFDRLPKSSKDFILALLLLERYQGTLAEVRGNPHGRGIENYEVETLLRSLLDEGWIVPLTQTSNGVRQDSYALFEEIGDRLRITIDVEDREPMEMLSLESFLKQASAKDKNRVTAEMVCSLSTPAAFETRRQALADPALRDVVQATLISHGGFLPLIQWKGLGFPEIQPAQKKAWREQLEENMLGTIGVISLKSYGIDIEEECLILFQELVESFYMHETAAAVLDPAAQGIDREYSVGVDLLIDIRRLLEITQSEALEVTREGTVFKKAEERFSTQLLTNGFKELFEGSPVNHLLPLCRKLELLDLDGQLVRSDPLRRKIWLKRRLLSMVRAIFELYQNEYRGTRWSFHQRVIREIFLNLLLNLKPCTWYGARSLFTAAVAHFLTALEKRGVEQSFRTLQMEDFHHETLVVPVDRLHQDLSYWTIHRLAVIGLVDLGFQGGNFQSIRISTLGCRFFKLPSQDPAAHGDGQMVLNPDFELLLFPGGEEEAETDYLLGCFADRTASERVKRYRLHPDSIKRGVLSGMTADEILKFLEKRCSAALPPNVKFSVREWAEGVEPISRQRVLLLKARTAAGTEQLAKILENNDIAFERLGELAIVIRGSRSEKALKNLEVSLKSAGLFLE